MLNAIVDKCEEIVDSTRFYGIHIEYEHDGAYSAKLKIKVKDEKEKSLGKLIFDIEKRVFIYKKYDNNVVDVFFFNWAIIQNLRMKDVIEIIEPTSDTTIKKYSINIRQLCEKGNFVNVVETNQGLHIVLEKTKAKCEKMKFNKRKKKYEVIS